MTDAESGWRVFKAWGEESIKRKRTGRITVYFIDSSASAFH